VTITVSITPTNPPITPTYKLLDVDSVIAEIIGKTKHNTLLVHFLKTKHNTLSEHFLKQSIAHCQNIS
jgi:hypothetical protein